MPETIEEDLTKPEIVADPATYFGHLRETEPVHWNPLFKMWLVTRYDNVVEVLRNAGAFSSEIPPADAFIRAYPPIDETDMPLVDYENQFRNFMVTDRPRHLEMRGSVYKWFTLNAVEIWRERLRDKVDELLEQRVQARQMEVMADLAAPIPLLTICWMLGLPERDGEHLGALAEVAMGGGKAADRPDRMKMIVSASSELYGYFGDLLDARAREPREDLVSMIADGERRGVFDRSEALGAIRILFQGGFHTSPVALTNAILAFSRNPEQWDLLRTDPDGYCVTAADECLRYDGPINFIPFRVAATDIELDDKIIRAGEKVAYVPRSANRDPRKFEDPDELDITRSPNPHVAFGRGIHFCLGSGLAKVEIQEVFKALAQHVRRFELTPGRELEYGPNPVMHQLEALHICWE